MEELLSDIEEVEAEEAGEPTGISVNDDTGLAAQSNARE